MADSKFEMFMAQYEARQARTEEAIALLATTIQGLSESVATLATGRPTSGVLAQVDGADAPKAEAPKAEAQKAIWTFTAPPSRSRSPKAEAPSTSRGRRKAGNGNQVTWASSFSAKAKLTGLVLENDRSVSFYAVCMHNWDSHIVPMRKAGQTVDQAIEAMATALPFVYAPKGRA